MKRFACLRQQGAGISPVARSYTQSFQHNQQPISQSLSAIARRYLSGAVPLDGNAAAAHVAYGLSELHSIYPITPSSSMSELADKWSSEGRPNVFGNVPKVVEMQSELGAAGALHGAAVAGTLVSTFTASQGLLLMIPNLYRIAGELLPAVFHVTARAIAGQGLSIYGDHSDVMAIRNTGVAMLASASPQECMDLGLVSHLSSIKASVPFVHFFDGFRTSHEINTVNPIAYEDMKKLVDMEALHLFRRRSMNPERPNLRGLVDNPEHYFQLVESANTEIDKIVPIVEHYLGEVGKLTGRKYGLFDYAGHPEPDHIIISSASSVSTIEEVVNYRNARGERLGLIKVRLWRPFSLKHLLDAIPKSVKKIAVLDKSRDYTALGSPLYVEVTSALHIGGRNIPVVGGRYGLGGKDFTPGMAAAVFDNLKVNNPINNFVVGITDDVTNRSLPVKEEPNMVPEGTKQSIFWGIGGDGTVGANEEAIKLIVENTEKYGQGFFAYSAHKSGGVTMSHLRFGDKPINSTYRIQNADLISVHTTPYLKKFPQLLDPLKENGTVILNSPWTTLEQMEKALPNFVKRKIARRKAKLYNVDATTIARESGLRGRINMVMQGAFFKVSGVLPEQEAVEKLKDVIKRQYERKGQDVLDKNFAALDRSMEGTKEIVYPASWADLPDDTEAYLKKDPEDAPEQVKKVLRPTERMEGDLLPVSAFDPRGAMPTGTSKYEKRGIATQVAQWTNPDTCTQCNLCSALCPHAAIRPFLFTDEEGKALGPDFDGRKAKGKGKGLNYRVQVSPFDCTGCEVCVKACPTSSLSPQAFLEVAEKQSALWDGAMKLPVRNDVYPADNLKGSQFNPPYLEFSGACAGCGETPIVKLLTQLFGDELYIANATGCSLVWGGMFPWAPYTTNKKGHGPAWAHSLFEDAAEYGFGIRNATHYRREAIRSYIHKEVLGSKAEQLKASGHTLLVDLLHKWEDVQNDRLKSAAVAEKIRDYLENVAEGKRTQDGLEHLYQERNMLAKKSHWIIGGDGWAYDIGFAGLDHVLASGEKVNILVLDNEVYANTGGQASKATPRSSQAKFASSGKDTAKKDLGAMMMQYGNVYVASVCLEANADQAALALKEAEEFDGPSLIVAYAPCISHGIRAGMSAEAEEAKRALKAGYHILYRYNPSLAAEGMNPLTIDSDAPSVEPWEFLKGESRYEALKQEHPDYAEEKQKKLWEDLKARYNHYKMLRDQLEPKEEEENEEDQKA